jgi:hypothetical protein
VCDTSSSGATTAGSEKNKIKQNKKQGQCGVSFLAEYGLLGV